MESRGRTFQQELRDAVWEAGRVVAVIGPHALSSANVRVEWEHALLFSKAIVPILRAGEIESVPSHVVDRASRLFPKFHTPDFRSDKAYKRALAELVRLLRAPVPALALLSGVPALAP